MHVSVIFEVTQKCVICLFQWPINCTLSTDLHTKGHVTWKTYFGAVAESTLKLIKYSHNCHQNPSNAEHFANFLFYNCMINLHKAKFTNFWHVEGGTQYVVLCLPFISGTLGNFTCCSLGVLLWKHMLSLRFLSFKYWYHLSIC